MNYTCWKRGLDFCLAGVALVVVSPLLLLTICVLILIQGPDFLFRQQRVGLHGTPFFMLKFRTMRHGDPPRLPDRPVAKHPADARVTPIGRLLRRLAIDELPQLCNVLRGEMSLVGPRPLPLADLQQPGWLAQVSEQERAQRLAWIEQRQRVLPGMTGLWQISPNPEADLDNWLNCDLAYIEQRSLPLDCLILLRTPLAILRGRQRPEQIAHAPVADHVG